MAGAMTFLWFLLDVACTVAAGFTALLLFGTALLGWPFPTGLVFGAACWCVVAAFRFAEKSLGDFR